MCKGGDQHFEGGKTLTAIATQRGGLEEEASMQVGEDTLDVCKGKGGGRVGGGGGGKECLVLSAA